MPPLIDNLISNPVYIIIGILIIIVLFYSMFRRMMKLILFIILVLIAFIAYIRYAGSDINDIIHNTKEKGEKTVK